jgi:hypothetical protein
MENFLAMISLTRSLCKRGVLPSMISAASQADGAGAPASGCPGSYSRNAHHTDRALP